MKGQNRGPGSRHLLIEALPPRAPAAPHLPMQCQYAKLKTIEQVWCLAEN